MTEQSETTSCLRRVISNGSGALDVGPWQGGVWVVVEDRTDICSISMTKVELEAFIVAAREIIDHGK